MPEPSKRILIIDDQPELCEVLKAHLKTSGYECKQAYDGERGFQIATEDNPDCILLDVRMPREDGFTFLRKLRAYRHDDSERQRQIRTIPVIVLTAAGDNMRALFEAEGIQEYVTKPFDVEKVKASILSVIRRRQ